MTQLRRVRFGTPLRSAAWLVGCAAVCIGAAGCFGEPALDVAAPWPQLLAEAAKRQTARERIPADLDDPDSRPSTTRRKTWELSHELDAEGKLVSLVWEGIPLPKGLLQRIKEERRLKKLRCGRSGLVDADLDALAGLVELEELRLSGNNLTDVAPPKLLPLQKLKSLSLDVMPLTASGMDVIGQLPNLEVLSMAFTNLSSIESKTLARFTKIRELTLSHTAVDDGAAAACLSCPTLVRLSLTRTKVTDAGMIFLAKLPNLEYLALVDTAVSDEGAKRFAFTPTLRYLMLSNTQVGDDGLLALAHLPRLELVMVEEPRATDAGVQAFRAERGPDLPRVEVVLGRSFGPSPAETKSPPASTAVGTAAPAKTAAP